MLGLLECQILDISEGSIRRYFADSLNEAQSILVSKLCTKMSDEFCCSLLYILMMDLTLLFVSPGKFVSRLIISLEQLHDLGHSGDTDPGDLSDPLPDWSAVYNAGL